MIKIHQNFTGGNICVKEMEGNCVRLENELRDTTTDWFYWAFCVEGAAGRTITFRFQENRLGYFGPAVSHDLVRWNWLESVEGDSFTYSFGPEENKVYFAHDQLYHPARFFAFAERQGLVVQELCKGYKGSSVPCVTFGAGAKSVILTARHHACESTGNYVLEGVLEELCREPLKDTTVFCVPFVDYEGVIRGDQGKNRAPHDHNRDYSADKSSIYPECAAIRRYAQEHGCHYGFDFHSPWHKGGESDNVFIVQNSLEALERQNRFGELLEQSVKEGSLAYEHQNDYPPEYGWNKASSQYAVYMGKRPENVVAFTLETAYFGTPGNKVSEQKMLELGRCFARALRAYLDM